MSTTAKHPAAVLKMGLRSGPGHRVTFSDGNGPVVSVWDADGRAAWVRADDEDKKRRALAARCDTVITRRPTR